MEFFPTFKTCCANLISISVSIFSPEDGESMFLQNAGIYL
jgi:hypothetical protein